MFKVQVDKVKDSGKKKNLHWQFFFDETFNFNPLPLICVQLLSVHM